MRKLVFLIALLLLTGCSSSGTKENTVNACSEVRATATKLYKDLPDLNEATKAEAKFALLNWAFVVTGDPECFSDELVATAKSAIALVG